MRTRMWRWWIPFVCLLGMALPAHAAYVSGSGFESPTIPELTVTGSCTRSTSNCRTGVGCYARATTSAACSVATASLSSGEKRAVVSVRGTTFSNDTPLIEVVSTGSVVAVARKSDGTLTVNTGATEGALSACATTTATITTGTYYRLDLDVVPESAPAQGDGEVNFRLYTSDGVEVETEQCTNATTGTGTQVVRLGPSASATMNVTYDDFLVVSGSTWPGDVHWQPLRPTSDSTCSNDIVNEVNNTANRYQSIDEPPHDSEATYLTNRDPVAAQSCLFGHTQGSAVSPVITSTIHAAELVGFCQKTGSATQQIKLLVGADVGSGQSLTTSFAPYRRVDAVDPATSSAWTLANLNAKTVGFNLAALTGGSHAECSALQWDVAFAAASPTPTGTVTNTPDNTATASPSATPTQTSVNTGTPTATGTVTSTPTATPTNTPTVTWTNTPTRTPKNTKTPTPTNTPVPPTATAVNTNTAGPTNTPANTPTVTPTPSPSGIFLGKGATCVSTPCASTHVSAKQGTKTVSFDLETGTISAALMCRPVGWLPVDKTLTTFTADGVYGPFTDRCEELWLNVTACGSSCSWTGVVRFVGDVGY